MEVANSYQKITFEKTPIEAKFLLDLTDAVKHM